MIASAVRGRAALTGLQAGRCSVVQEDGVTLTALLDCQKSKQICSRWRTPELSSTMPSGGGSGGPAGSGQCRSMCRDV